MKTYLYSHCRAILLMALIACSLTVSAAEAEKKKKTKKHRGVIESVNHEEKSMVLYKPGKPGKEKTVMWTDDVKFKPKSLKAKDLKPGMYVRCMVGLDTEGKVNVIRHQPEMDVPPEEEAPAGEDAE